MQVTLPTSSSSLCFPRPTSYCRSPRLVKSSRLWVRQSLHHLRLLPSLLRSRLLLESMTVDDWPSRSGRGGQIQMVIEESMTRGMLPVDRRLAVSSVPDAGRKTYPIPQASPLDHGNKHQSFPASIPIAESRTFQRVPQPSFQLPTILYPNCN
jgi:hypothetical protein